MVMRQDVFELQQCSCLCAVALPAVGVASKGTEGGVLGRGSRQQGPSPGGGANNLNKCYKLC